MKKYLFAVLPLFYILLYILAVLPPACQRDYAGGAGGTCFASGDSSSLPSATRLNDRYKGLSDRLNDRDKSLSDRPNNSLTGATIAAGDGVRANAEEYAYACVRGENVYLCASESEDYALFILPQSYYVRVLQTGTVYAYVEYLSDGARTKAVRGYCRTDGIVFVDYTPRRPYLFYTVKATYLLDGWKSSDPTGGADILSSLSVDCAYYGDYPIGAKTYCYVLLDGEAFGYIPKPDGMQYEINTEYDDRIGGTSDSDAPVSNPDAQTESLPPVQIAVLVLLCILVPVVAALILRSSKKSPFDPDE